MYFFFFQIILRQSYLRRHCLLKHFLLVRVQKNKKKKNEKLSSVSVDRRAAALQGIHHIIELFGAGNRSVTCSCFMLQHTVNCHSLTNPPFLSQPSVSFKLPFFSVSGGFCLHPELQQTRRSQNVLQRRVRNGYQSVKINIIDLI